MSDRELDSAIPGVACDVVAWSSSRVSAADLPILRKAPGNLGGSPMTNGLLRHADEQTVVGVAAVLKAVNDSGLDPSGFERWSVLAAPRYLGRAKFEVAFPQYRDEGAWGVSPHLVPGHSLHSPSGTISQALQAHGPNLGIGGTPGGEHEAFLVAATWLDAGWSEGVWVVLTSRDPVSTGKVAVAEPGDYRAIALAIVASRVGHEGTTLQIAPRSLAFATSDDNVDLRRELLDWLEPAQGRSVEGRRGDPGHPAILRPRQRRVAKNRERI